MARLYKRNDYYYVDYTYRGKRYRKSFGKDKKIAELALKDTEVKIAKGEFLGITDDKKILFENYAEKYLNHAKTSKAQSSYLKDCQHMKTDLLPFFSRKFLNEIDAPLIDEFKTLKASEGKVVTTNRNLALLKHMFTKAMDWKYLSENPAKVVKLLKEPRGKLRYLTQLEIDRLLKELNGMVKAIVVTALNTGMRKGELLNLKWEDVDLFNDYLIVEYSKNGESRKIPINDMLKQELMNLPRYGDFVFSKENGDSYGNPRKAFKSALKRAQIENFRFHDLRHSFSSLLAMSGVPLRTIADLLGHKTIQMTMRYSHLSQGHLKEAVNLIGAKFSEKGTNLAHPQVDFDKSFCKMLKNE